jgi:hypothetical protein
MANRNRNCNRNLFLWESCRDGMKWEREDVNAGAEAF